MVNVTDQDVCPPNKRNFVSKWDEIAYLCAKIMYYFHCRRQRYRAKRFVIRLTDPLQCLAQQGEAIIEETANSLICEYDGRWKEAALHRQKELELIFRLYKSFTEDQGADVRQFALQGNRKQDVIKRLSLIVGTYEANTTVTVVSDIHMLIEKIKTAPDI